MDARKQPEKNNKNNNNNNDPMEIDPIDDGPPPTAAPTPVASAGGATSAAFLLTPIVMTKEEEAREAIESLRADDMAQRVTAAHRLSAIATVLGPERTRAELIPFVTDGLDDEDEVLIAISMSLGSLVPAVGGAAHAHVLLRPLEFLLTVEEASVRERASESTYQMAHILPDNTFAEDYANMLGRLARKEWFTARMSATRLIAAAYARLYDLKQEVATDLLQAFCALCRDDTPMVRRVAAQHLGTLLQAVVQVQGRSALTTVVATQLLPLYEFLASQDQPDSVRLQTTENCVAFGQVMSQFVRNDTIALTSSELDLLRQVLPLVLATIDDRSWRVRWTAAAKFAAVVQAYDVLPDVMDSLVPSYERLLQDPEAEVRTAATLNLAHVAQCQATVPRPQNRPTPQEGEAPTTDDNLLGANNDDNNNNNNGPRVTVAERLVKRVTSLTEDESEHVRAALAMVATELAPILGREATISHLVPPVLLLLRDAASEVRLNLIASLSALNEVIGVDLLSQSLLPAILDLAQDGKWRIRLSIIQQIPLLADHLGRDFFTERLASLCVGWLGDDIATIRHAAAVNLKELTALFGTEWTMSALIPPIADMRHHESYLRRLTALEACALMSTKMDPDTARLHALPLVLEMATDAVPNIRFNVAKELEKMAPVCGVQAYETQILPVLTMLMEDDDRDVRYYAEKTATALDEVFADEPVET